MTTETNKTLVRHFMERAFNEGDLTIVDESLAPDGIDHQEPLGTNFATHLKAVITMLRTCWSDASTGSCCRTSTSSLNGVPSGKPYG